MEKPKKSAGILLYRIRNKIPEILLVHPGGPFWSKKDAGAWGIPKGELNEHEDPLKAALREFEEETGTSISGKTIELKPVTLKRGKIVYAWAMEGDIDVTKILSNTFEMEWPPKSGKKQEFPEIDRGEWFEINKAREKINNAQEEFIDELLTKLNLTD